MEGASEVVEYEFPALALYLPRQQFARVGYLHEEISVKRLPNADCLIAFSSDISLVYPCDIATALLLS
jgi:hypothetical protein